MSSSDELAKVFSQKCDTLINEHPDNRELENAVIELEVCHTNHINAIKREFNAQLDTLEAEDAKIRAAYTKEREQEKRYFDEELKRITADYQKQMEKARETHQADMKRVKDNYQTLLDSQQHSGSMVSQMQEDHRREIARLKEEHERVLGNKEREIARLNRRLSSELDAAGSVARSSERSRRASVVEVGTLRRDVMNMQLERNNMEARYQQQIKELVDRQEFLMKSSTAILNDFQDKADALELALSKLRASQIDMDYEKVRAKLAAATAPAAGAAGGEMDESSRAALDKDMERLDQQRAQMQEELKSIMEKAQSTKKSNADALQDYQKSLEAEMARLHEMRKKGLEMSTEQRRRAYSISSTPSAGNYVAFSDPANPQGGGGGGQRSSNASLHAGDSSVLSANGNHNNAADSREASLSVSPEPKQAPQ